MVHDKSCFAYAGGFKIVCYTSALNLPCLSLATVTLSEIGSIFGEVKKGENACTCLRCLGGCIPHLEFSWWSCDLSVVFLHWLRERGKTVGAWLLPWLILMLALFLQKLGQIEGGTIHSWHPAMQEHPDQKTGGTLRSGNNAYAKLFHWSGLCARILWRPVVYILECSNLTVLY